MVETPLKNLIERFRGKPEWQHADAAVRAEAVLRLPSSEADVLLALSQEDPDPRVRRAAVKKLVEPAPIAAVAQGDADASVRDEAEARLAHLAVHEHEAAAAAAAVAGIREPRHLATVAKAAPLPETREAAVRALADGRQLASIVRDAVDLPTRLLALDRIQDPDTILALALKVEQKAVAVAAVDRIQDEAALRTVAEKARAGAAARRARSRLDEATSEGEPVAPPPVQEEQDEAERRAYEEARAAHEREAEARAAAVRAREELATALERAEGDAILPALERARAERAALPPSSAAEAEALDRRIDAVLAAAEGRHAAYLAGLARRDELVTLAGRAEEAAALESLTAARDTFAPLEARWREVTADADLPEARARFEAAARALRSRGKAQRDELARKDHEHLEQLSRLADQAEGLVACGQGAPVRDVDHALRDIKDALEHPGHFPSRRDREVVLARLESARKQLYPLLQQLREDAEWKRWANVTVQEELCARVEALAEEENLEKAAAELRDIDARWKQAKEAPKETAEALWLRFKTARDQVKSRTDAFYAHQAEELSENLRKKDALCEKAEALAESTDWVKTAEELRRLQAEWKETGPVPRAASRRTWERFRRACDRFFTRWHEERGKRSQEWTANLAKKEALCEKAEALRDSTAWEEAAAELRGLQAEWRTIGAVKRSRSDAVWNRFRAACDHFFDRYKNRDEHARQAAQTARETICADLEGLLPAGDTAGEPPSDLVARVEAAQTAWRQAGSLPHDQMSALDERFARARDRLVEAYPGAFEGTDLDPETSRRRAEKLVSRVEGLLHDLAPSGEAMAVQTAQELAARLRDALATNTIGGRAAVEAKWQSASADVEAARTAWRRLGPLMGEEGRALAERFERACRRFSEARPRTERPRGEGARSERGPRRPRR